MEPLVAYLIRRYRCARPIATISVSSICFAF